MGGLKSWRYESNFDREVERLRNGEEEKVDISKSVVGELPDHFEESYPANAMQNEGAIGSHRDDRERNSLHVIEYEDKWEVHIDEHNPKYAPLKHLMQDAPGEFILLVLVVVVAYKKHTE